MSNNQQLLLEVKNLKTYFQVEGGTVKAVDDVSFNLYRGETIGIVGESGSGKSVTSLSIMRLIAQPPGIFAGGEIIYHPANGSTPVNLLNLPIDQMRQYRGNNIAMIFQEPMTSLNPVFQCGFQVAESLMLHRKMTEPEAKKRVLALFEEVKLPNPERIYDAYPHQLSGGQKQRVMIAMAMSCEPDILIADEPTTALDVTVQKHILELMRNLQEQKNNSTIFITHDLGVIAEIADRVIVMYKGKIVEQGTVLDIFSDPKHPYTKSLLACRPPLGKRLSRLPVVADFMSEKDGVITEKNISVREAINAVTIDPETTKQRMADLQKGEPVLQVRNLKTYFPTKRNFFGKVLSWVKAVDDVSFDVFKGETLGLVGESGCGKTTLGRTILRLAPATDGSIIYKGKSLLDMNKADMKAMRREMQIIFQDPYSSLNPRMTIGDAIIEPLEIHGILGNRKERLDRAGDLLTTVSMSPDHLNRYPHEFSGGQRQRICIARALALEPEFIICDESVSALDVSVQAQVLNLLIDLRKKFQFTYIFVSHDLSVVKFMSDRMVVMNQGKIEEMGISDDIYYRPQREYTQKLIAAIPKGELDDIQRRFGIRGQQ
jgi:peptide/nickel transport system ATP-binding protein